MGADLESNAGYGPVRIPEFKLRSGSLKWSLNLKDVASQVAMIESRRPVRDDDLSKHGGVGSQLPGKRHICQELFCPQSIGGHSFLCVGMNNQTGIFCDAAF